MPKIIQYRSKCIGCGFCHELQPELWRISRKDGKATLLKGTEKKNVFVLSVTETAATSARLVAAGCPVRIIKVV
ncbi:MULTISPECIES: ferredoxin [Niastella]|uniref:Ferredoxin n=1 Tax=Niastella soli TaxID=2821487 RepID=A0ABS3YX65_9BACT|nr:ferredoxin [Niastella soli]MBO9202521.1 ferredoxin [Niastella soli]